MELHRFFRYAIEKMCKEKKSLNHFNKYLHPTTYPQIVKSVLEYLQNNIMFDYNDPKGFQGNINDTTFPDRNNLRNIVSSCLSKVNEAIWLEQYYSNESAINKWIEIFKDKFPGYGK